MYLQYLQFAEGEGIESDCSKAYIVVISDSTHEVFKKFEKICDENSNLLSKVILFFFPLNKIIIPKEDIFNSFLSSKYL